MGSLFPMTDNVSTVTGEGYVLGFRAGAELIQMEFCHFLPTLSYPEAIKSKSVFMGALNGLLNKGGARLYNSLGERFMKKYYPDTGEKEKGGEQITRAIGLEICQGRGSAHGGIYLDLSDVPAEMLQSLSPKFWESAQRAGIDLRYQPVELAPNPHDLVGGVKIDDTGATHVQGLFAAGEAAGGAHGASRFGGSALAEALAFGDITGRNAALFAMRKTTPSPLDEKTKVEVQERIKALVSRKEGVRPLELRKQVQQLADKFLNVGRNKQGLEKALQEIDHMERELLPDMTCWAGDQKERGGQLRHAIEVDGQVELAKIIATAALLRQESRGGFFGGHYRSDYPDQDDRNWLKNIVLKRERGRISSYTVPPVLEE